VALSAALGDHIDDDDDHVDNNDDGPAAAAYLPGRVKGLCFYNCGVGLNSRGIVTESQWSPFQRFLFTAVLNTLDLVLFKNPPVLTYLLNKVVTKDLLRGALEGLYRYDPTRVDDELIDSFYYPAKEKGAPEALGQIYTNDPGRSPMDLHAKYSDKADSLVIHLIWGDDDAVTPLAGGVGTFYSALADDATTSVTMDVVGKTGHIPFDDNIECNGSMLRWIKTL
jgi:pimeloyl-ACP methyl ester carboxylesterase